MSDLECSFVTIDDPDVDRMYEVEKKFPCPSLSVMIVTEKV